jgi:hypothetical protein
MNCSDPSTGCFGASSLADPAEIFTYVVVVGGFIGIVWLWSRRIALWRALLYATAFAVLPLSHLWHLLLGESSLTSYCPDYATLGDQKACIDSIPATQYWNSPWWELEGALVNTWEFTVAHEVLVLKILGGVIVLSMFSSSRFPGTGRPIGNYLAGFLFLEAAVGLLLFSTASLSDHFQLFSALGLFVDLVILAALFFDWRWMVGG